MPKSRSFWRLLAVVVLAAWCQPASADGSTAAAPLTQSRHDDTDRESVRAVAEAWVTRYNAGVTVDGRIMSVARRIDGTWLIAVHQTVVRDQPE